MQQAAARVWDPDAFTIASLVQKGALKQPENVRTPLACIYVADQKSALFKLVMIDA